MSIRLDVQAKMLLEKAASFQHRTVSDFVLDQAISSAKQVIREHESTQLPSDDWEIFMEALSAPPAPSAKLIEAFRMHKKMVRGE